jgi:tripartite-type tricarboxylate transporter receptor subunit TctC
VTRAPGGAQRTIRRLAAFALGVAVAGFADAAAAQPAAEFYRNHKPLTLVISSSAGGGYDGYGRMFARYMSRYLPGNPTFVLNHMPGAGGARATSYLYNAAARFMRRRRRSSNASRRCSRRRSKRRRSH